MDMKILFRRKSTKIALFHGAIKYLYFISFDLFDDFTCKCVIKNFYGILNMFIKLFQIKYILLFFSTLT